MRLRTLFLVLPWLWFLVTAFTHFTGHPWTSNSSTVRRLGNWIVKFQKDQNRLPESLAELRAYANLQGDPPDIYDNYGNRLYYQPITETGFYVKSFGRDGAENTVLISRDESFSYNIPIPPRGVKLTPSRESRMNFYQAPALDGLQAPKGTYFASLQSRFRGGVKRILVQSLTEKQFFMTSVHDGVEEFLWLPSGSEIVFTAMGSSRYDDGLYYWNLQNNRVQNLLPDFQKKFFPSVPDSRNILLSLSHASAKPDFLYIFAKPAPDDGMLDPKEFYRYQNFFALNPKADFAAERVVAERDFNIFDYTVDHRALIESGEANLANPSQKAWIELSLEGGKQDLLEAWQSYCSTYSTSGTLPYALWWLLSVYNDTYRQLIGSQPENARTVRNFALEIADALSQLPSGPAYMRMFAEHIKKNLQLSKPASYNVTLLTEESEPIVRPDGQNEMEEGETAKSPASPIQSESQEKDSEASGDKAPSSPNVLEPKPEK